VSGEPDCGRGFRCPLSGSGAVVDARDLVVFDALAG
jgi:hypothetical protein